MSRKSGKVAAIPGTSCFTLTMIPAGAPKPKRSRFSEGKRKKVGSVRAQGACFRCQMKKIEVGEIRAQDSSCAYNSQLLIP